MTGAVTAPPFVGRFRAMPAQAGRKRQSCLVPAKAVPIARAANATAASPSLASPLLDLPIAA
jgi:hypothetical protein